MTDRDGLDRRQFLTLAGGAAATAVAGCTGDQSESGGENPAHGGTEPSEGAGNGGGEGDDRHVVVTQGQLVATLDPQNHGETPTTNVLRQAYETLLFRDRDGRLVGQLAEDWELVEEGHARIRLREGVRFHSGSELTASDAAYSVNRVVDNEVDIVSAQKDQLPGIDRAEADEDDDLAVHIRSGEANPTLFANLATTGHVLEESWVAENDPTRAVNGTGPYRLVEYTEDVEVVFERFDDYWGEEPEPTGVTFNAASETSTRVSELLTDATDVVVNVPPNQVPRIEDSEGTRFEAKESTRVLFCPMRFDVEPFDSTEFRQAMNYAVDLDSIIENVLDGFGEPTAQPALEGYVGHNDSLEPYPYDPERAAELVEASGYAGAEITLQTPAGRYLEDVAVAEAIAAYVDELPNVSCSVERREFGALVSEIVDGKLETKPPFHLIGFGNPTFDAARTILPYLVESGAWKSWYDERVDQLMAEAESESDPEARAELLEEVARIVHEEAPWLFLHRQYSIYGVSERLDWSARADERIIVKEFSFSD